MARIDRWVDVGNGVKKGVDSRGRTWVIEPQLPENTPTTAELLELCESSRDAGRRHFAKVDADAKKPYRMPDAAGRAT